MIDVIITQQSLITLEAQAKETPGGVGYMNAIIARPSTRSDINHDSIGEGFGLITTRSDINHDSIYDNCSSIYLLLEDQSDEDKNRRVMHAITHHC